MKTKTRLIVRAIIVLFCLGAVIRCVWYVSHFPTGRETVARHWREATSSWFGCADYPLHQQKPDRQARFWLDHLDRWLAESPDSAEFRMGLALALNLPADDYYSRFEDSIMRAHGMFGFGEMRESEEKFEQLCAPKCLELAKAATTLEPDESKWWQLRAILLFMENRAPRTDDSLAVLEEAKTHDSNNGLYDLLIAYQLFQASCSVYYKHFEQLDIHSQEQFHQAISALDRALSKPITTTNSYPILEKAIRKTGLPLATQDEIRNAFELTYFARDISRYQSAWANTTPDKREVVLANLRCAKLFERLAQSEDATLPVISRTRPAAFYDDAINIALHKTVVMPGLEINETRDKIRKWRAEGEVAKHAMDSLYGFRGYLTNADFLNRLAQWAVPRLIVSLLFMVVIFAVFERVTYMTEVKHKRLGFWPHLVTWSISTFVCFLVFGLAPAEFISATTQAWIFLGFVVVVGIGTIIFFGRKIYKFVAKRRDQDRNKAAQTISRFLLWSLAVIVPLCVVVPPMVLAYWTEIKYLLNQPEETFKISPADLHRTVTFVESTRIERGTLAEAMANWAAYRGAHVTSLVALCMVVCCQVLRTSREDNDETKLSWRHWIHLPISSARRTVFGALLFLSTTYLFLLPNWVAIADADRLKYVQHARRTPEQVRLEREAIKKIKADKELMKQINNNADRFIQSRPYLTP